MIKEPRIRFKKFNDKWNKGVLSDVSEVIMGQSPSSQFYTDNSNDTVLIQGNADLKNGKVVPRVWTTESKKQVIKNDIIFSVRAPVGDLAITDYDAAIGRGVAGIRANLFIYYELNSKRNRNYWKRYSTGSTFDSVNSGDILNATLYYPENCYEQTQIGDFFKELGELIELQQAAISNLEEVKKGFLSKVYPDYGKKETKISFGSNSSKWTINHLKNLSIKEIKGSIQAVNITNNSKDTTLYLDANRLNGGTSQYTMHNKDTFYNDIIMLWDGSKAGQVFTGFEGVLGSTLKRFVIKNEYDSDFIFYQLVKHENRILLNYRTPNIPHVVKDFSTIFKINDLKDLKTQKFIGGFFRDLDKLIELEKTELKLLQEMKKGFLQKMFV